MTDDGRTFSQKTCQSPIPCPPPPFVLVHLVVHLLLQFEIVSKKMRGRRRRGTFEAVFDTCTNC